MAASSAFATQAAALLRQVNGRSTRPRHLVLESLLAIPGPHSHAALEARLAGTIDRVTLYRVLDWLVAQGLAARHTAPDRSWRFEVLRQGQDHRHPHLSCERCGQQVCLDAVLPALSLPPGWTGGDMELSVRGRCPACQGPDHAAT